MCELGAFRAHEEAVKGLDLNDAYGYVGVSAGSFIAARAIPQYRGTRYSGGDPRGVGPFLTGGSVFREEGVRLGTCVRLHPAPMLG